MTDSFHVGQRVVCVDNSDVDDTGTTTGIKYLRRGRLYTVARTYVLPSGPGVNLQEIDRPYSYENSGAIAFGQRSSTKKISRSLSASSKLQADL